MNEEFSAGSSGSSLWWGLGIALLLDLPMLVIFFLSGGVSHFLTIFVLVFPLLITGLLVYISLATRRMFYILKDEELYIDFSAAPLTLPYNRILNAGKVETQLILRVFGGSWPGSHWGIFTTKNVGNAQVYSTRYKGEFIQLEVTDGTRILLSPAEPDAFLTALKRRVNLPPSQPINFDLPQENRKSAYLQVAAVVVVWIILVAYVAAVYPQLPDIIPVHFGFDGKPNRWGNKIELVLILGIAALFPALNALFALKFSRYNRGLTIFLSVIFIFTVGMFGFIIQQIILSI